MRPSSIFRRLLMSQSSTLGFPARLCRSMPQAIALYLLVSCMPAAATATTQGIPEGSGDEWILRLEVESGVLADPGNVIGLRTDSLDGYDVRDLVELPPFAPPFLTIVFPHPDWGDDADDYTTDYREARPGAGGTWSFEVRSDVLRTITLRWVGILGEIDGILARSRLRDEISGDEITPALGGSYEMTMTSTEHAFSWRVDALPLVASFSAAAAEVPMPTSIATTFTDEDPADGHTAVVDWGDGGPSEPASVDAATSTVTASHAYGAPSLYAIDLCVTDDLGGEGCALGSAEVVAAGDLLFQSGFESGDLCDWSATEPPVSCPPPPP